MNIQRLPLTSLQRAPYNPRQTLRPGMPAYERLKRSLEEFDLVQPIVWNRTTGHVVGGHQRLQILADRGETDVECVVIEVSPEREKALNIALNNAQVGGTWDQEKLIDLVGELQALPDFDATLTGFSETDLKHLLFQPEPLAPQEREVSMATDVVQVILDVSAAEWTEVQPALDALLARFPRTKIHVRT